MTRTTALASLLTLALAAGAAHADNIVGGGDATISGGGDNLTVTYNTGGAGGGGSALIAQPGQVARVTGNSGGKMQIEYLTPAPAGPGREAWLVGGGDNTEVVYRR